MASAATIQERRENVAAFIKERPGEYFSAMDLCKRYGVSPETARKDFRYAAVNILGGDFDSYGGKGYAYIPKEEVNKMVEEIITESEPEQEQTKEIVTGQIWEAMASNGKTEQFLIIAAFDEFAECLQVFEDEWCKRRTMNSLTGQRLFYDPRKVVSKPTKYLTELVGKVQPRYFDEIRQFIGEELGCKIEVEIEVEKEVEVEPVKTYDLELALLRQKVEIYERLIFGERSAYV